AAQLPLGAHLAGDPGDLVGEPAELVDHRVDGVLQLGDLAAGVDGDLLGEVAVGDGVGGVAGGAHLVGQVAGHEVDVVGQVLPRAGHARYLGLAAQPALGAHLTGDTGHLVCEAGELIDHRVDGVLQLEDLALGIDGDLLGQVAAGD